MASCFCFAGGVRTALQGFVFALRVVLQLLRVGFFFCFIGGGGGYNCIMDDFLLLLCGGWGLVMVLQVLYGRFVFALRGCCNCFVEDFVCFIKGGGEVQLLYEGFFVAA